MTTVELAERLGLTSICEAAERQVAGCYIGDMLSRVMSSCGEAFVWITVQTSNNMLAVAEFSGAACVILPEGIGLSASVAERAEKEKIGIYGSQKSAFELAVEIDAALNQKR